MTIQFVGNFTDAMKSYSEEKIYKLQNKGIECENVRVKLDFLPSGMALEISVNNKIRNSKKGEDFYALVVDVVDSISSQINRYKKFKSKPQHSIPEMPVEELYNVNREKLIFLESMSQEDAIETMEALGHTFFIFKDIDRQDDVCVVYKRKDDTYGILQCK